ncbi:mCG10509, isoform CRA_d [Mus musculus]|nr:mCG10509, isoform CRA_d [Mus musculus]
MLVDNFCGMAVLCAPKVSCLENLSPQGGDTGTAREPRGLSPWCSSLSRTTEGALPLGRQSQFLYPSSPYRDRTGGLDGVFHWELQGKPCPGCGRLRLMLDREKEYLC